MMSQATRRHFLHGRFSRSDLAVQLLARPFGALDARQFEETCTSCGDCALACPEGIIVQNGEDLPSLDVKNGACTFCGECTKVCEAGALIEGQPWYWRAETTDACLAKSGTHCRSCEDHCDAGAIRFRLMTAGRAEPQIDLTSCTGCGGCVAPCPVGALSLTQMLPNTETQTC